MPNNNPFFDDDEYQSRPPQEPQKPKMSTGKKVGIGCLIAALIGAILLFAMGGCAMLLSSTSTDNSDNTQKTESTATTDDESKDTAQDTKSENSSETQNLQVGQTVTLEGVDYTLNSVTRWPGDEISQPDAGNEYLIFNWTVQNNTDEEFSSALTSFSVYVDSSAINETITTYSGQTFPTDALLPGTEATGDEVYEVPASWSDIQVRIKPFLGDTITYNVTPNEVS